MNFMLACTIIALTLALTGCSGGNGAGHWFHILFVIIPFGIALYFLNKKVDDISKSLFKIEGQLSQIATKVDKSEKKK